MKLTRYKIFSFMLAAAFALTLAGCGGGGGGTVDTTDPPVMPETCPEGQVGTPPNCATPEPVRPEANAKSVMAKAMAIMALEPTTEPEKAFGAAAGPFDADADNENMNYDIGVKYGEVTVTDEMGNDDAEDDMKLMHMGGSMFARENKDDDDEVTSTEKVIVYTDVKAPTPTKFAMVRNAAGELTQGLNTNPKTTGEDDNQSLTVADNALANVGGVPAAAKGGTQTIPYTDDVDTEDVNEASFDGTYNGASGTYECTGGGTCSTTSDDEGVVTDMEGTWRFTPATGATSPVPDYDYLHYGFWVDSSTNKDGDPVYAVQTFSGGSMEFEDGQLSTLSDYATKDAGAGSATYDGTAAGVYAQKIAFDSGTGALVSGHAGSFTADVTLTAEFGEQTSVAQTKHNTISGTISNFMDGEFELGWTGTLKSKEFGVTGATSGGEGTADGSWTSSFFGPSAPVDHDDDDQTGNVVPMPTGVAGEFVVHFGNGHTAGAYGATR